MSQSFGCIHPCKRSFPSEQRLKQHYKNRPDCARRWEHQETRYLNAALSRLRGENSRKNAPVNIEPIAGSSPLIDDSQMDIDAPGRDDHGGLDVHSTPHNAWPTNVANDQGEAQLHRYLDPVVPTSVTLPSPPFDDLHIIDDLVYAGEFPMEQLESANELDSVPDRPTQAEQCDTPDDSGLIADILNEEAHGMSDTEGGTPWSDEEDEEADRDMIPEADSETVDMFDYWLHAAAQSAGENNGFNAIGLENDDKGDDEDYEDEEGEDECIDVNNNMNGPQPEGEVEANAVVTENDDRQLHPGEDEYIDSSVVEYYPEAGSVKSRGQSHYVDLLRKVKANGGNAFYHPFKSEAEFGLVSWLNSLPLSKVDAYVHLDHVGGCLSLPTCTN